MDNSGRIGCNEMTRYGMKEGEIKIDFVDEIPKNRGSKFRFIISNVWEFY